MSVGLAANDKVISSIQYTVFPCRTSQGWYSSRVVYLKSARFLTAEKCN